MEAAVIIFIYIVLAAVSLYIGYLIILSAVRNGVKQANVELIQALREILNQNRHL